MPGIGIISNPKSKKNRNDPALAQQLAAEVEGLGALRETRSLAELDEAMQGFRRAGIDILAINGGDGSLHLTLTSMVKVFGGAPLPKIAILRGGTLNTVSNGIGVRGNPRSILQRVVRKVRAGEALATKPVKLLRVEERYGFIFGNGLVANFLDAYYGTGDPSPATAARLLAVGIGSSLLRGEFARRLFDRVKARISFDGEEQDTRDVLTLAIATVPEVGLGFTPWYRCDEDPSRMQALLVKGSPLGFVSQLPAIYAGKPIKPTRATDRLVEHIRIEAETLPAFTLDGDLYKPKTGGHMDIRVGPRLEVILG